MICMTIDRVIQDASKLSAVDRLELVGRLWDTLCEDEQQLEVPAAHRRELDRRLAELEHSDRSEADDDAMAWPAVRRRLLGE